jgi:ABC-type phosphate/phosphonate transport system substrate-binding protein
MTSWKRRGLSFVVFALLALAGPARGAELRIAIVQAQAGEARKYQPLLDYLQKKGVAASFVAAPDYRASAEMFGKGSVDAMFGGSGIAGTMILKGLADPLVRAVGVDGSSTYHAVVIAPKGSPRFTGSSTYFDGKKVILCALASAGEFFLHSAGPSKPVAVLKAASHGAALDALARGQADVAIVKNHVWNKERRQYEALEEVGADVGENPDGSLIVSKKTAATTASQVASALLGLQEDASPEAAAARDALKIKGYIPTSEKDFAHTLGLLKKAGVTKDFAWAF